MREPSVKREVKYEALFLLWPMQGQNIIRAILFVVFFSVGAASLGASVLCDDLVEYYRNRQLLKAAQEFLNRLKSLNTDYDILLEQLEKDPNLIKRIAPATLGTEQQDVNTVYPRATPGQLAIAKRVLAANPNQKFVEPAMPEWLTRCSEPRQRILLFFSGGALILISFICFGPPKQITKKER